ncbi:alpha/beta fold hydrolase [Ornithinimicrobium sp. Y1694]|uniref:alpha/beta fold hydrolase n=1 Tax=Ornithinimicrobium sp. Y1694 TaxID=3418590 RepID=UPI003CF2A861
MPSTDRSMTGDQRIAAADTHDPVGLPVSGVPGLDPTASRVVTAPDASGHRRSWHVLDTGPLLAERGEDVAATLLCVHGNPTWSYLWRRVVDQAPAGWRVIAVDQLGMGFSERAGGPRDLATRIEDLARLTRELDVQGPTYILAHDWGGPVSLGWALQHRAQLAGVVLTNTAVHQPAEQPSPSLIRLARSPHLLARVCRDTPVFVSGTTALSLPGISRETRKGFAAPYRTPGRRAAVATFVQDIPFEPDHPSRPTLDHVADGVRGLSDVPALFVWGTRDPVFGQRYLEDLLQRMPHADVQRYPDASHLVLEDRPEGVEVIWRWLGQQLASRSASEPGESTDDSAEDHADVPRVDIEVDTSDPERTAVVELAGDSEPRTITFGALAERVDAVARGLSLRGIRPGDRVAVMVPPGIELTTLVYALWRLGAVVVIADAGLGLRRLGAALRSAGPRHIIGIRSALVLAAASRIRAPRIRVETGGTELDALAVLGRGLHGDHLGSTSSQAAGSGSKEAAVLFTSGATGSPKGVVYTRDQLGAQVALLRDTFDLTPGESLVAAFAPFALYGPALGLTSAVPDMDVTAPDTLTASALADAVGAVGATAVFASPAALRNVVATADDLDATRRQVLSGPCLLLSAGAPVPVALLHQVLGLLTSAETQTPYGMTEVLPLATHDPTVLAAEIADGSASPHAGVCVGHPVRGVEVGIAELDAHGIPRQELVTTPGVVGEIVVRGPHVKERYDRLWSTQDESDRPVGWHRTGDVGHLDESGRLWVEGRLAHVVTTAEGPVTPYAVEDRLRTVPGVEDVAVVGVGPEATQQVAAIIVPTERLGRIARVTGAPRGGDVLADPELAAGVRAAAFPVPVSAVLLRDWLPVDVRHASKVDRGALSDWAHTVLHGEKVSGGSSAPRRRSR